MTKSEEGKSKYYIDKKPVFDNSFVYVTEDIFDGEFKHLLHNPVTGEYKKEACNCKPESE